jgi:glycosyltransferase involved in cell wall biosynthesis
MSPVPLVSAIIPTFNRAAFVGRAIDSALDQTWPNVEVIVTDDGSTDNTAGVLAGYGDRIRVVSQRNQGLSAARNAAIEASSGSFLALLDDDDEWLPERLAVQMPYMLDNANAGLVGGSAVVIDTAGKPLPRRRAVRSGVEHVAFEALFPANQINCPTALIRRSVMDSVGPFDTTLPYAEDYDMWLRIAAVHQVIVVPQQVARYRIWQGNKSGEHNANIALWVECHLRIRERCLLEHPALRALPPHLLEAHCFRHFRYLARYRRRQGDEAGAADLEERLRWLHQLCGVSAFQAGMHRGLHWLRRRVVPAGQP